MYVTGATVNAGAINASAPNTMPTLAALTAPPAPCGSPLGLVFVPEPLAHVAGDAIAVARCANAGPAIGGLMQRRHTRR